jgi:hypothetical protein
VFSAAKYGVLLGFLLSLGVIAAMMLHSAPVTAVERAARLPRWVGCYRLELDPFRDGTDMNTLPFRPPPAFRLDTTIRVSPQGIPLGFMTVTPESPNARHPGVFPPGWDLFGRDSAVVFWSDGFVGVELRIPDGSGPRPGVVEISSDVVDPSHEAPRTTARATPVPCGPNGP